MAVTIVNYIIGDYMLLPGFGNIAASIADGFMAPVLAYLVFWAVPGGRFNGESLALFGSTVAVSEYVFHLYLMQIEEDFTRA